MFRRPSQAARRRIAASLAILATVLFASSSVIAAAEIVSLSGHDILKNGREWVPKGVVIVGLVAPDNRLQGRLALAHAKFGSAELTAIRQFGADLIRFQVSQAGCDPQSQIYAPAYLDEIAHAVRVARAMGFIVIASLQSEKSSGVLDPNGLPGDSTTRAWHQLAPRFAGDRGVMFELFNEPSRPRNGASGPQPGWEDWRSRTQPVLDEIRRVGAHNVVIVDGLQYGRVLAGAAPLNDPDSSIAYGVHPYPRPNYKTPTEWDAAFGRFAGTHPVIATEWNALATNQCQPDTPQIAQALLTYLKSHRIGVVGWAFDYPGALFDDDGRPTSYAGFDCNAGAAGGAGELLHSYFMTN